MRAWLLVLLVLLPVASAHVPSVGGGAREIDGARSWAFFEDLASRGTDEWSFSLQQGERLLVIIAVPVDAAWSPEVTLEGPEGIVPLARADRVGYEPFTPFASREVWSIDEPAPASGAYTLLVTGEGGPYSFGYGVVESFTPAEWLLIPVAALRIHLWEGQPLALLALPYALALLLALRRGPPLGSRILSALFLGSALSLVLQMARAFAADAEAPGWAWVATSFIACLSLALAFAAWRARRARAYLPLALAGAVAWSGLLLGPLLAVALAIQRWRDAHRAARAPVG